MIQRIQSLFLLLASASFWSEFGLSFATSDEASPGFLSDMVYNIQDHGVLLALTILGGVISLGAIFLFNNRALQLRLSYLTVVMAILLPLVAFLLIYNDGTSFGEASNLQDGLGIYPPILALICGILAGRYIGKDDKLVKSMDRLR